MAYPKQNLHRASPTTVPSAPASPGDQLRRIAPASTAACARAEICRIAPSPAPTTAAGGACCKSPGGCSAVARRIPAIKASHF